MQVNVAGLRRNIKNLAHNYSDAQVKVREATSNDPWGPSATIMAEIADLTYNVVAFSEIMQMIWKRLNDHGKNWRHVYKALILLEYLIKTGTEKVAQQCKENIFAIQTLREFEYFEEGKDQGTHVREKAKQLVNLLKDDERLKNERVKALKAKERFAQHPSGFGSDGYIDGPSQRDMPPGWQEEPTKPVSELEMVRPQTAGEEELQLQLAMAMSREEAEQEEAKRRSDDVRLQLALSQSEQDFSDPSTSNARLPEVKKEEPQSHLLDLLDISLGATSISSPPLGAVGGVSGDMWGTPARAASQLSDPWSGTSSPQIDPWQPAALRAATASAPLGAVGGMGMGMGMGMNSVGGGASNGEAWALRTQSPSVASGSSTEGWLHSNGAGAAAAIMNGNSNFAGAAGGAAAGGDVDTWLSSKSAMGSLAAAAPPQQKTPSWLSDSGMPAGAASVLEKALSSDDPWAPKLGAANDDPWRTTGAIVKPSPDMDEFDIITNRNKTGDLLTNNFSTGFNNNTSLLDDLDLLSSTNLSTSATAADAITTNTKKQPLKTPQAFLGENSALVNLDNLIKPVVPQTQSGNAAYNPFSDTVIPPKTNLFQQQQPVVPSINQLKQQQPFTMTVNQDPWAPVANANATSQPPKDYLIDYDTDEITIECNARPPILNSISFTNNNPRYADNNASTVSSNNVHNNMPYSKSDYNVCNTSSLIQTVFANNYYNSNINNNNNNDNNTNNDYSHSVDNIRDMQITSEVGFEASSNKQLEHLSYPSYSASSKTASQHPFNDIISTNNNNSFSNTASSSSSYIQHPVDARSAYATSYSSALSASLAATPGVKISPFNPVYGSFTAGVDETGAGGGGGSLFSYGFYDPLVPNNAATSSSSSLGNCKMENTNNNMPWVNPEAATSNPFLS